MPYAQALARAAQGCLILLRATAGSPLDRQPGSELAAIANRLRAAGIIAVPMVASQVPREQVGRTIADRARAQQADLIVMASRGRGGLGHWVPDSVAEAVIRQVDVPVLLVSTQATGLWPADRPLRLLMPLDDLGLAEAALEPVGRLARSLNAELHLLRLIEHPHIADPDHYPSCAFNPDADVAEAQGYRQQLARRLRAISPKARVQASLGAATTPPCVCQTGIDLVALVTRQRDDCLEFVLGDFVDGMFQPESVPLLIVRPKNVRPSAAGREVAKSRANPAGSADSRAAEARQLALAD